MLDAAFRGPNSRTRRRSSTWRQRTNRSLADNEYRVTFEIERIADAAVAASNISGAGLTAGFGQRRVTDNACALAVGHGGRFH
jgi:hypothetical protein